MIETSITTSELYLENIVAPYEIQQDNLSLVLNALNVFKALQIKEGQVTAASSDLHRIAAKLGLSTYDGPSTDIIPNIVFETLPGLQLIEATCSALVIGEVSEEYKNIKRAIAGYSLDENELQELLDLRTMTIWTLE